MGSAEEGQTPQEMLQESALPRGGGKDEPHPGPGLVASLRASWGSLSTPLGTSQAGPELSVKVSLTVERGQVPLTRATGLPGRPRAGASWGPP